MKEDKQRNKNHILANLVIIGFLVIVIIMIAIPIIRATTWYEQALEAEQQELKSYSPDTYGYLLKSIGLIFREDEGVIDINAKPDDIIIEKIEMQDDGKFICELYLDKGEMKKYFPNPNITAELSGDFEILYTSSPYVSEEEFVNAVKTNIKSRAIDESYKVFAIEMLVLVILLFVPYAIKIIIKSYKRTFQRKK